MGIRVTITFCVRRFVLFKIDVKWTKMHHWAKDNSSMQPQFLKCAIASHRRTNNIKNLLADIRSNGINLQNLGVVECWGCCWSDLIEMLDMPYLSTQDKIWTAKTIEGGLKQKTQTSLPDVLYMYALLQKNARILRDIFWCNYDHRFLRSIHPLSLSLSLALSSLFSLSFSLSLFFSLSLSLSLSLSRYRSLSIHFLLAKAIIKLSVSEKVNWCALKLLFSGKFYDEQVDAMGSTGKPNKRQAPLVP